jgi:hypothetical protein
MPQSPFATNVAKNPAGAYTPLAVDAAGNLVTSGGGTKAAYNVAAAAVIKAGPGRLAKVVVLTVPSAGNLTLNDVLTTGGAAIGNEILSIAFGSLTAGQVISLDWPCATGIVVSSVGTAGVYAVSYD